MQAFALEGIVRLSRDEPALADASRTLVQQALSAPAPALRARARKLERLHNRATAV